jgi:hypothetical protein
VIVDLIPGCPVTQETVKDICEIDDDAYRNRWIVYAYHDISLQLRDLLGDSANFATFATWSSRIIGEQIRAYARPYWLEQARDKPRWRLLKPLFKLMLDLQQKWRERTDGSVGQVMGYGNRMIFREIACELARFAEEYHLGGKSRPWPEYRETIAATPATQLFPAADLQRFCDGMHAYYLALDEVDAQQRAELVLRGTLLISSYEQWRVDVVLKAAMSLYPRRLLRVPDESLLRVAGAPWQSVELSRRQTPWMLRHRSPWRRWLANRYARSITRRVMNLEVPRVENLAEPPPMNQTPLARAERRAEMFEPIRLGRPLPLRADGSLNYPPLETLRDPDTAGIFDIFDRSKTQRQRKLRKGYSAKDWSQYDDRMSYIAIYFRARQGQPELFANLPYEYRVVSAMDVSDENLDKLRLEGDPLADELCIETAAQSGQSGRALISLLLDQELSREHMGKHLSTGVARTRWDDESHALPSWADDELLRLGQKFFQRFKVEIASALFGAALPKTYTAWRGARVLTVTADRIAPNRIARPEDANLITGVERRVAETGQMLLDVMGAEDRKGDQKNTPFRPGTQACEAACGVRLFHASVRHQLLHGGEPWDETTFGKPVNQEDLIGTLAVFTVVVLEALKKMGAQVTQGDRDAYVHLWLVVGHFLGVNYELLFPNGSGATAGLAPLDYEELRILTYRIYRRNSGFSVDGCRLEDALLEMQRASMRVLKALPVASVRAFLGDDIADGLGVPHTKRMRHLIKLMFAFNVVRTYSYHVDWFASLVRRRTQKLYVHFINRARGRPAWRMDYMESFPRRTARKVARKLTPGR